MKVLLGFVVCVFIVAMLVLSVQYAVGADDRNWNVVPWKVVQYSVMPGDDLWGIAGVQTDQTGVTKRNYIDRVLKLNKMDKSDLQIGEVIYIYKVNTQY